MEKQTKRKLYEFLRWQTADVHYENALDDLYYGYGYKFWRNNYDCDIDLTEDEAKLVWSVAKWIMTDGSFLFDTRFPSLEQAYKMKRKYEKTH